MKKKLKLKSLHFAVGALVIGAFLPIFIKNDYYMMVLNRVLINIIVVLGLNFITGLTGQMNLGTAGIFALGAYSSALFTRYTNLTPWLGLIAAVIMGILIGRGLGYPSQKEMYYLFLVFTAIAFFIAWRIAYSKWGRIFKSLRDNVEAVEMSGVDIASCKIKAFTVASIFGTVAGAMYAHYMGYINPSTFNLDLSTNYVVMLMVGGLGSVVGTIFGSAIVTILPEMLRFLGNYYQIVFCSIILLGAIFFPDGWVSAATGLFMKMYQRISGKSYAEGGE